MNWPGRVRGADERQAGSEELMNWPGQILYYTVLVSLPPWRSLHTACITSLCLLTFWVRRNRCSGVLVPRWAMLCNAWKICLWNEVGVRSLTDPVDT